MSALALLRSALTIGVQALVRAVPRQGLAASTSASSIVTPFEVHLDVIALAQCHYAGVMRGMVGEVCRIIGRTDCRTPASAQLCGSIARTRDALLYSRAADFATRERR